MSGNGASRGLKWLSERGESLPRRLSRLGVEIYVYMANTGLCLEHRKDVGMFC